MLWDRFPPEGRLLLTALCVLVGLRPALCCAFPASLKAGAPGRGATHRNAPSGPALAGLLAGYSKLSSAAAAADAAGLTAGEHESIIR